MTLTFIISFAIFAITAWIFFSILLWSFRNGISPMPTSSKAKKCMMDALPKEAPGPIYELGSGWGSLAFPLAKRFSKTNVTCYETSLIPFLFSKVRHFFNPLPNLKIIRQDFFQTPLPKDSLVICYLYPGAMRRLKLKFEEELSPKALIVSNTFAIPGWRPISTHKVPDLYSTNIYLYKIANPTKQ